MDEEKKPPSSVTEPDNVRGVLDDTVKPASAMAPPLMSPPKETALAPTVKLWKSARAWASTPSGGIVANTTSSDEE